MMFYGLPVMVATEPTFERRQDETGRIVDEKGGRYTRHDGHGGQEREGTVHVLHHPSGDHREEARQT